MLSLFVDSKIIKQIRFAKSALESIALQSFAGSKKC